MGKIIEGLWDCPFCGNKRIRAGQKNLSRLWASAGRKIQNSICRMKLNMFLRRKQKKISRNPDWQCSFLWQS